MYNMTINHMNGLLYLYGLGISITSLNIICSSFINIIEHNGISCKTMFLTFIHILQVDMLIKIY